MSSSIEKHLLPLGGEPRQFEAKNHHLRANSLPLPANPPTPIDELSTLIKALHSFAPDIFEVHFPEQNSTRSIEIGSVEVWELFVATLRPETTTQQTTETQVLYSFIENKLR